MQNNTLIISKTARYSTIGSLDDNTTDVWFVIHGYGQLAEFFIQKFQILDNGKTFIVAPEALSKFYLKEFSGRVGATWMTKEDRENEISDYLNYLNQLYSHVFEGKNPENYRINILGFSQGTATVCRWCMNDSIKYDRLILWAGFFGKGIQDIITPEKLLDKDVVAVYGTRDEFLVKINLESYEFDLTDAIPHIEIITFDGTHTIVDEALKKL
jgi:predicted esterase